MFNFLKKQQKYTIQQRVEIAEAIERDIKRKFGNDVYVTVYSNGSFDIQNPNPVNRYDLYPGMSRKEADAAVIRDLEEICRRHIQGAIVTDYTQHGVFHRR